MRTGIRYSTYLSEARFCTRELWGAEIYGRGSGLFTYLTWVSRLTLT